MTFLNTVGIDVSKQTLDATIFSNQRHGSFRNNTAGFKQLIKWVKKHNIHSFSETLFCCEHTGLYSLNLCLYLIDQKIPISVVSGLAIKRSQGLKRGKSDKIDSRMIADYAFEKKHKLPMFKVASPTILKLQQLRALRRRYVRDRAGCLASVKEASFVLKKKDHSTFFNSQSRMINYLTKEIKRVENQMNTLINQDEVLKRQYDLLNSIKGVGSVIATAMIIYTAGFTKFETWRQFACFIGTAPFEFETGTSIKYKSKVHHFGHREIKSLIHMGALSAKLSDPELKIYYQRRIDSGKSKMSTLNIIRNKLLARIFAVINNDKEYVILHRYAS